MLHRGKASTDQLAAYKALVLAFIAERGPVPRSDIWQSLHGRVTVGHVDQSLTAPLREGRIRATKATFAKSVDHSNGKWVVPYTATVYEVASHDG